MPCAAFFKVLVCIKTVFDAVLCKVGSDHAFRDSCCLGLLEHSVYGVVDVVYLLEYVLLVVCCECFLTCVDYSAAVDDEVRCVQDAASLQSFACSIIDLNCGMVFELTTAPRAHGAKMSQSTP